jgi:hypothetical protein
LAGDRYPDPASLGKKVCLRVLLCFVLLWLSLLVPPLEWVFWWNRQQPAKHTKPAKPTELTQKTRQTGGFFFFFKQPQATSGYEREKLSLVVIRDQLV